ncbi:MAG: acetylglucosamine-6-sulfatase [Phycisphaera sp.]|nr:acetylglucosamine-6-sulfatase [Phycisphaera sp.]
MFNRFRFAAVIVAAIAFAVVAPYVRAADGAAATADKPKAVTPEVQTAAWAVKWWMPRHEQKLAEKDKMGRVDLLYIGDSIIHGWENSGKATWDKYYGNRHALNLGFSGDRTEQVIWRIDHGEVDGIKPRLAIVMIGTNNTGHRMDKPEEIAAGVKMILDELGTHQPDMKVLLLAIFPRGEKPDDPKRVNNEQANAIIKTYADDKRVFWMNINDKFLTDDGILTKEMMPDRLHPKEMGYGIWAEAIEPTVKKLMGEE